ncbi:MAG: hypothetical protein ACYS80_27350, partial [Planctomycetota bacterium]
HPITEVGHYWETRNPGWNSSLTFDDSDAAGWKYCINNRELPYIWVDGPYIDGSSPSYYRKVFYLSGTPASGLLSFGCDDDAIIYINGQLAVSDTDGYSTDMEGIDVTSLLVPGMNLIAVKAHDSWGYQESFKITLDIDVPLGIAPTKRSPGLVAVLSSPMTASNSIQLEAQFFSDKPAKPPGRYDWSIVHGDNKVRFMGFPGDHTGLRINVQPIAESTYRDDVEIKVKFTSYSSSVPSCEASYQMTIVKPTSLNIAEGFPEDPNIYYNSQGGVVGYDVDYAFQVYDQFDEPIPVMGMQVEEWMDITYRSHNIFLPKSHNYAKYWTNDSGIWEEVLAPHRVLIKPIPENYLMEVDQDIYVEGWLVDTRRQTYYYNSATSE